MHTCGTNPQFVALQSHYKAHGKSPPMLQYVGSGIHEGACRRAWRWLARIACSRVLPARQVHCSGRILPNRVDIAVQHGSLVGCSWSCKCTLVIKPPNPGPWIRYFKCKLTCTFATWYNGALWPHPLSRERTWWRGGDARIKTALSLLGEMNQHLLVPPCVSPLRAFSIFFLGESLGGHCWDLNLACGFCHHCEMVPRLPPTRFFRAIQPSSHFLNMLTCSWSISLMAFCRQTSWDEKRCVH